MKDGLTKLTARHEAMLLRLVSGATANEVCFEFGISASRLSVLRASELWTSVEGKLRQEILEGHRSKLGTLVGKAITALDVSVSDSSQPMLRLQSAKEILNRTGFGPAMKLEQEISPVIRLYIPKGWVTPTLEGGDAD